MYYKLCKVTCKVECEKNVQVVYQNVQKKAYLCKKQKL
jgi:hypothetical protein